MTRSQNDVRLTAGRIIAAHQAFSNGTATTTRFSAARLQTPALDTIALEWQPICNARSGCAILYHEALVRFLETDSWHVMTGAPSPMIERYGGSLAFDRLIALRVIEVLRSHPLAILGVNISSTSADPDRWGDVFELLRSNLEIANRLIVEITQTAPFNDIGKAALFCAQLQICGVRIALDEFGGGHSSVATALALSPAIVKIDGRFVQHAFTSRSAAELFRHLVGVATSLDALAIVGGVETQAQADVAKGAGGIWQQGHFHGQPTPLPSAASPSDFVEGIGEARHAIQALIAGAGTFTPTFWNDARDDSITDRAGSHRGCRTGAMDHGTVAHLAAQISADAASTQSRGS